MSKTYDLRKLVTDKLNTVPGATYHRKASADAEFPYKVYYLQRVECPDSLRDLFDLCVDVWGDADEDFSVLDNIGDAIESLFNCVNLPKDNILPTFFRSSRFPVDDPDKSLLHLQLHFDVQLYERS